MSRIHEALKKAQEERAAQQAVRGANSQDTNEAQSQTSFAPAALLEAPEALPPSRLLSLMARSQLKCFSRDALSAAGS